MDSLLSVQIILPNPRQNGVARTKRVLAQLINYWANYTRPISVSEPLRRFLVLTFSLSLSISVIY